MVEPQEAAPLQWQRSVTSPPVIVPIIHINGDRKATLLCNLEAAYHALGAAQDALRQCAGNARNFYPDPGRWERYVAQHRSRQEHIQAVMDSLAAEAEGIDRATRSEP